MEKVDEKKMLDLLARKKVLLVEPFPGKYPPLGLAKIASYVRSKGGEVEFGSVPRGHDLVAVTTLFTYDCEAYRNAIANIRAITEAPILIGGVCASLVPRLLETDGLSMFEPGEQYLFQGFSQTLDQCVPDYSINWGKRNGWERFSFTFTSRGCVNNCAYCAVPRLERVGNGGIWVVSNWRDHIVPGRPCVLLDNNLTASPGSHLEDVVGFLVDRKVRTVWDNGIDCKHVDRRIASLLGKVNWGKNGLRIAFDRLDEDGMFQSAVNQLIEHGVAPEKITSYVLFNFNDKPKDAEYRLLECTRLGIRPYPQRFIPLNKEDRKNSFVGKYWTKNLVKAFQHFGIMGKFRGKTTFGEFIRRPGVRKRFNLSDADLACYDA